MQIRAGKFRGPFGQPTFLRTKVRAPFARSRHAKQMPATSSVASSGAKASRKRSGPCKPFLRCTRRGCRSAPTATAKQIPQWGRGCPKDGCGENRGSGVSCTKYCLGGFSPLIPLPARCTSAGRDGNREAGSMQLKVGQASRLPSQPWLIG